MIAVFPFFFKIGFYNITTEHTAFIVIFETSAFFKGSSAPIKSTSNVKEHE